MIPVGQKAVINAIKRARQNGNLNLQNLSLETFPEDIVNFSELQFEDQKWWDTHPLHKIDMTNNNIQQINGEVFEKEREIMVVRFINNQIIQLPTQMFTLEQLKSIDFTHNNLTEIPQQITQCISLVEILLPDNKISQLPNNLSQLQNLERLILTKNNFTQFPNVQNLSKLKFLDLGENYIEEINPNAMVGLFSLEQLILIKNQLNYFSDSFLRDSQNLVVIQLDQNKLKEVSFPELPKLDQLSLSYNQIQKFQDFDKMQQLTVIILNNNKLTKLSKNIMLVKELKTLDIANNDLGDIPSEIGLLPKLVRIQLEGNPLKCIRQSIRNQGAEQLKKYLVSRIEGDYTKLEEELNPRTKFATQKVDQWEQLLREFCQNNEFICRQQGLTEIDERVFQIDLRVLDLQKNQISQLSSSIGTLLNLKKINLQENKLFTLPLEFLNLQQNIAYIELKSNNLSDFFSQVPYQNLNFQSLTYLDLSINQLTQVPQCILSMPNLTHLLMSYNKIRDIDIIFNEKLENLQVIDFSNNKITHISDQVAFNQPDLSHLNLANNDLQQIPTIIGFMQLTAFQIEGNPLKIIKRNIIDKGTVHILEYLKTKHPNQNPQGLAIQNKNKKQYQQERQREDKQKMMEEFIDQKYENYKQNPQLYQQNSQFRGNLQQPQQQNNNSSSNFNNPQLQQPQNQNISQNQYGHQQQIPQHQVPQQQLYQQYNQQPQQQQQFQQNMYQNYGQINQQQQQIQQQQYQQQQPQFQNHMQQKLQPQINRQQIQQDLQLVSSQINELESEIRDNFQLNNLQKQKKRRELQQLLVKRSELQKL
ncbi:hypothetical protein PPERSA_08454 [Pseudocohnilembus persalinus]|uniref:Uncharacterized protein n=1 Tax=Pseudocohnilembus persalinus TaxID=266149 RepID=A0A0V0R6F1_PSEPJ|nr:hypothetical protein PPERSA_08454 [Pseudocohnilembus persalinus]|eukprot:KRX10051.1 hypothetical protein PPERSA_08454 [Pseudocohnilembus persalinus]